MHFGLGALKVCFGKLPKCILGPGKPEKCMSRSSPGAFGVTWQP